MATELRKTLVLVVVAFLGVAGCASHTRKVAPTIQAYSAGERILAAQEALELQADHPAGDNDRLLYLLESGQILTVTGQIDKARDVLDEAAAITRPYLDEKSEASVSQAAAATLLNPTVTVYVGTSYDRVMLSTLQAMTSLQASDPARARVELNQAALWQQDAVLNNAARIEKAQQEIASKNPSRSRAPSGVQAGLDEEYDSIQNLQGYSGYVNPYTEHLSGVFRLSLGNAADAGKSVALFRRAADVLDGIAREAVLTDVARAQHAASGRSVAPATYVYFLRGLAPKRQQFKLRVPIPFRENNQTRVIYIAAAFPKLVVRPDYGMSLAVEGAGQSVEICNMDGIVAQTFKDQLPLVITQSLVSAAAKGAAQYGLSKLGAAGNIAGILLTEISTSADLRSWETLPKAIRYVRVDTPSDGRIVLTSPSGKEVAQVQVEPGRDNIVWITLPSSVASPMVTKAVL